MSGGYGHDNLRFGEDDNMPLWRMPQGNNMAHWQDGHHDFGDALGTSMPIGNVAAPVAPPEPNRPEKWQPCIKLGPCPCREPCSWAAQPAIRAQLLEEAELARDASLSDAPYI